ncbi:MAG TPA: DUF512 domain-containing protein [Spirochaetota bacterium]|nr:DUF512 domain-containing protein [Spirochaetota bacterium]HPJ15779.1 DUF512 domain-containing protein [Spirochaetota bacterium]HPM34461.1 DUF512 domain-containing protein [Spirochaetota bacterium]
MIKIINIKKKSPADRQGLLAGDEIISINGMEVRDYLDYKLYSTDFPLEYIIRRNGETYSLIFDEEEDAYDKGIDVEDMKIKHCGNKCIFCFVDQNPTGLRKGLYLKDEDFRYSFLYGSYFTLSNIRDEDLKRIKQQHLSPLYISVHAAQKKVRMKLLGINYDDGFKRKLSFLTRNKIELHTQIVLCPGVNDGKVLDDTVKFLHSHHPYVLSVAVVPVGKTCHRDKLFSIDSFTETTSAVVIKQIESLQKVFLEKSDTRFVFAADEFYLKAGFKIPNKNYYENFSQYENGVGMSRIFLDELKRAKKTFPKAMKEKRNLLIVTGKSFYPVLIKHLLPELEKIQNLSAKIIAAENRLFGSSVTVSGLLCGNDIIHAVKQSNFQADKIILPDTCLNFDEIFLDDMTLPALKRKLKTDVEIFTKFSCLFD